MKYYLIIIFILIGTRPRAQSERWQQRVKYTIDVQLDDKANLLKGKENIIYWNNSPDTLDKIFIHLYWNAFQPGSMMDIRSQVLGQKILGRDRNGNEIRDWDSRVTDRISKLTKDQIGYQEVESVEVNGEKQQMIQHETILEVVLKKPILPKSENQITIPFEAQVPIQIRRSGRDNAEGVAYSMSQWYPKIVEYDYNGWNANPYIAREFYGVWGDYNVNITLDKNYLVAATGTISNPNEVGYGYGNVKGTPNSKTQTTTWHFIAHNVHDFVWAADSTYTLIKRQINQGPLFYFVYKKTNEQNDLLWNNMADSVTIAYPYIAKTFGVYPYQNYSFIQGGDGGMEYPMATLIRNSSVGTALHEFGHSWFQGVLGSNESLYPWMDEGGATYLQTRTSGWMHQNDLWYLPSYNSYYQLVKSGLEEPMSTHADHYNTNYAYNAAAYGKGAVFYEQLSYIIGNKNMDKFLKTYYRIWQFKHPNANDLIRVAEKVSGLSLEWYKQYWVYSTKTIDYAIGKIGSINNLATVQLIRIGDMPMPLDVQLIYKDGSKQMYNIPIDLMYGHKPADFGGMNWIFSDAWPWTNPSYILKLDRSADDISSIIIDPSQRMADVDKSNNIIR